MLGVKSVVFPACAALCALALLYKVRDVRHSRCDPALVALLVAFSCKGVSFTLSTPRVSAAVDSFTGVPNLGALGIHLLGGVASSAAILIAVAYWVYPPDEARRRALRRLVITALCAAAMLTMWGVAGSGTEGRSQHYLLQNTHRPAVAVYLLIYVIAFGSGMVEIIRLCRRYGRVAGRQWLRRGLYATGVGAAAYVVYCVHRASAVVAVQLGLDPLRWELMAPLANGIGICFLTAGLTMPSWGPKAADLHQRMRNFLNYQRLQPLWRALHRANPHIVLEPRPSTPLARILPGDINYRLYREIIEIQDGLLALRPYMDPAVMASATQAARRSGLSGQQLNAVVQATALRSALRAKCDDRRTEGTAAAVEPHTVERGDYEAEVAWLLSIARAYSTLSPSSPLSKKRSRT
ncbi:MAB_1171c family putative transporter [Streptomyces sp. NPDC021093]|uniref:MAB_1171c family putative transporter n=1 Tax=Streptomyces sp. NPDC021093 TaxID=3365112 RepID=UPI0037941117